MSAKKSLGFVAAAAGLIFSANAVAAEVKIEATVDAGLEYHFQLLNTDDGLRAEGTEVKETDFLTKAAKLSLRGKLTDTLSWNLLYQLNTSTLERLWLTNKFSDQFEVHIGQQKIKTFGWHRRLTSSATSPVLSSIIDKNPLKDRLAVDLVYKMFGTWSLAAVKDFYDTACPTTGAATPANCKSWNAYDVQKQPALVAEWIGVFGDFQPLLQYSRYDRNHSSSLSAGLRYKNDFVDAHADYTLDERNVKGLKAGQTEAEDLENKTTGVVVYGEFYTGLFTPYLHFSNVDVDQYTAPGASQPKVNGEGKLDDNDQIIAAGVFYEQYGKMYRPYLGIASTQAKFADTKNPDDEETRTKFDVMLGLTGKF